MATFKRDFNFKDNILEIVSYNVRKYRKEKGITQEQLAVDIGISYDYLRRFETQQGKEGISFSSLYKISVVLNTPLNKFVEEDIDM